MTITVILFTAFLFFFLGALFGYYGCDKGYIGMSKLDRLYMEEANLRGSLIAILEGKEFTGYYYHQGRSKHMTISELGGRLWEIQKNIKLRGGEPTIVKYDEYPEKTKDLDMPEFKLPIPTVEELRSAPRERSTRLSGRRFLEGGIDL